MGRKLGCVLIYELFSSRSVLGILVLLISSRASSAFFHLVKVIIISTFPANCLLFQYILFL